MGMNINKTTTPDTQSSTFIGIGGDTNRFERIVSSPNNPFIRSSSEQANGQGGFVGVNVLPTTGLNSVLGGTGSKR